MTETKMQLVDWLDDLCVRFIINLPQEELESVARICFQVEEAQWFYEDFIRPIDPSLPSLNLRTFCLSIFQHCPLLSAFSDSQHLAAYQEFIAYKTRVPVRGAILLNDAMDEVVLVKGWKKGSTWSFPRGKINKDEKDLDCAVREVYEETGYDINAAGLVPDEDNVKAIDMTMREQHLRMFVFRGVPTDTYFEPRTRKEISKIQWYRLADLPAFKKNKQNTQSHGEDLAKANKFYMVAPFLVPLKKWIAQQKRQDAQLLHGGIIDGPDMPSDAGPEPIEAPTHIDLPSLSGSDPAAELKRLLSVGTSQPAAQVASKSEVPPPPNPLLAILHGNLTAGLALPQQGDGLPKTPMEQIIATPQEPDTPHYHHPTESPHIRRHPPPAFQFQSPNGSFQQQPSRDFDPVAHNMARNGMPPNLQYAPGPSALPPPGRAPPQWSQAARQGPPQQFSGPSQSYFPPQAAQAPFSHGPVAPKASQLPPPKLTNHTMGLLSAFRSGPGPMSGADQAANLTRASSPPNAQPLRSPIHLSNQPTASHQKSLLDLFRSPAASRSSPVAPLLPQLGQDHFSGVVASATLDKTPQGRPPPSAQRRPSAMNMYTRTLPKMKVEQSGTPAPVETPAANTVVVPAKNGVRQQEGSQQKHVEPGQAVSRPPMTILARPISSPSRASPSGSEGHAKTARGRQALEKAKSSAAPATFTLLQRPSSAKPDSPARTMRATSSASSASEQMVKNVAPKILQRPKTTASPAPDGARPSVEDNPVSNGGQRDTLLALFAKAPQATSRSSSAALPSNDGTQPLLPPEPVHPASMTQNLAATTRGSSAWNNFSTQAQLSEIQKSAQVKGRSSPEVQQGGTSQQRWNETFKQTQVDGEWLGGPRKILGQAKTVYDGPSISTARPATALAEAQRVRVGSTTSVASNGTLKGGETDGMRSPTTPAEAKGFLLDFLNGVVKGEHHSGAKRAGGY